MNVYRAEITILPKDGVLDIQGKAVEKTLKSHGYEAAGDVRVGKFIRMSVQAEGESDARELVKRMADDLLVNDLIEAYTFALEQVK